VTVFVLTGNIFFFLHKTIHVVFQSSFILKKIYIYILSIYFKPPKGDAYLVNYITIGGFYFQWYYTFKWEICFSM